MIYYKVFSITVFSGTNFNSGCTLQVIYVSNTVYFHEFSTSFSQYVLVQNEKKMTWNGY